MAVTLKDVAERAGVSLSTVSRAFSHPHVLAPETMQRIHAIADELRYVPNPIARALITGVSRNIGLVAPDISNPYATALLKSAQSHARTKGLTMLVADTDENRSIERELCERIAQQADGVILFAPRMSKEQIRQLSEQVSLVLVNRVVDGVASVLVDYGMGTRESVDHLVDLGHSRIAYLPGPRRSRSNRMRTAAVTRRAAERGVELVMMNETAARHDQGIAAASGVIASRATAVIAFDDLLAVGLMEGLYRQGLSVPGDVSVTGHDDVFALITHPALTTVAGRSAEAGRLAVDLLTSGGKPRQIRLPSSLVIRESTGRAR